MQLTINNDSQTQVEQFQPVWELKCKHCNVQWSSRGMEAMVMARPAIRCFSTDLPPLSCDVVYPTIPESFNELVEIYGSTSRKALTHHARRFDLVPSGPCDCHVQDIACLGCGNIVGYYIHRPCFRCLAQRLRIKQRGYQHLWTFYYEDVSPSQRKSDNGYYLSWEDLSQPNSTKQVAQSSTRSNNPNSISNSPTFNSGLNIRQEDIASMVEISRANNQRADSQNTSPRVRQFPELIPTPSLGDDGSELTTINQNNSNDYERTFSAPEAQQRSLLFSNLFQRSESQQGLGVNTIIRNVSNNQDIDANNSSELNMRERFVSSLRDRDNTTPLRDSVNATSTQIDGANRLVDYRLPGQGSLEARSHQIHQLVELSQQRIVAERVLANPRSSGEAQAEALNTLSRFRTFQIHRSLEGREGRNNDQIIGARRGIEGVSQDTGSQPQRARAIRSRVSNRTSLNSLQNSSTESRINRDSLINYQIQPVGQSPASPQLRRGRSNLGRRNAIFSENRDQLPTLGSRNDNQRSGASINTHRSVSGPIFSQSTPVGDQPQRPIATSYISQRTVQSTPGDNNSQSTPRVASGRYSSLGLNSQNQINNAKFKNESVPPAIMTWLLQSGIETMPKWESSTVVR
ncbi:Protein FAM72D [Smittium mucronatum]|uniref:Protein FAM72D n=1 Tax=Smittium mucronatum TaxID=133383 RepID=A0A1R0GQ03_9FUNG|nr:Protein FAM72D [Smittium mucronatum]